MRERGNERADRGGNKEREMQSNRGRERERERGRERQREREGEGERPTAAMKIFSHQWMEHKEIKKKKHV